jgi:hypothetical protein
VAIGFVAAEPIETFTSAVLNNISTSVATAAGVDPGNVIVTASAASTRIDIIITTPSATASTNIEGNMVATMFSDASVASSVLGLTVTSAPNINSQTVLTITPPAMSAGLSVPNAGNGSTLTLEIAIGVGVLVGGIAVTILVIRCRSRNGKIDMPATRSGAFAKRLARRRASGEHSFGFASKYASVLLRTWAASLSSARRPPAGSCDLSPGAIPLFSSSFLLLLSAAREPRAIRSPPAPLVPSLLLPFVCDLSQVTICW